MIAHILGRMTVLILALGALPTAHSKDMNLILTLDRATLQRHVDHLFPIRREDALASVTLSHPQVVLKEGSGRIGLRLRIAATAAQQLAVSGAARVDGVLRFLNSSGEFYLDDASIEELQIDNVPSLYLDEIRQLADGLVRDLLEENPIYTLGQMGESRRILGSEIRAIVVRDGRLVVELALP